ncbi:MAG: hypothetical protein Q9163_003250 [Psora crenata]
MNVPTDVPTDPATGGHKPDTLATADESPNPKEPLEPFGWPDLETRFHARMAHCTKEEESIQREFQEWVKVFKSWAQTTEVYEAERAAKRLRTRMKWVQTSEADMEVKRQLYIKVVDAFEGALALCGGL